MVQIRMLLLACACGLAVTACANGPADEAREKLVGQLGVRWSPETFIQAAMNGNTQVVTLFLEGGMPADTVGDQGKTALIWAGEDGHADTAELLLDNLADPNAIDKDGKTALMWAVEEANIPVVELLLAKKADVAVKALDGSTALSIAQKNGDTETAALLQRAGATG